MRPGELVPQRCRICETYYPCKHACGHHDCMMERGEPLPDWASAPWYTPKTEAERDFLAEMDDC